MKTSAFKKFFSGLSVLAVVGATGLLVSRKSEIAGAASPKLWDERTPAENAKNGSGVDAAALNRVFVDLAKQVAPAVVNIYTATRVGPRMRGGSQGGGPVSPEDLFQYFFGNPLGGGQFEQAPQRESQALGSGFVINADGVIVTNSHVVRMNGHTADSIMVKFNDDPDRSNGHEAKVLGVDESTDVAVLQLSNKRKALQSVPLANSDKIQVGEWVVAIGNPYGHSNSVTKGIVSALGRSLEQARTDFIQTDASINPGNSGGPLFNLYGEVVGINTAIDARAQGIGFAIPINTAKSAIKQIIEKGEVTLGWVGVMVGEVTPPVAEKLGLKEASGVLIQDVIPGEPAAKGGIKAYDVIVEANGRAISSAKDFLNAVASSPFGTKIKFKLVRDGKVQSLDITVGKRKSEAELARQSSRGRNQETEPQDGSSGNPSGNSNGKFSGKFGGKFTEKTGLVLADLSPQLRQQLQLDSSASGAVIDNVVPGSAAETAGLNPGDVITEVNRKGVASARAAQAALLGGGDSVLLKVQRRSASIIVFLDLSVQR